jgi:hypothetical protein
MARDYLLLALLLGSPVLAAITPREYRHYPALTTFASTRDPLDRSPSQSFSHAAGAVPNPRSFW